MVLSINGRVGLINAPTRTNPVFIIDNLLVAYGRILENSFKRTVDVNVLNYVSDRLFDALLYILFNGLSYPRLYRIFNQTLPKALVALSHLKLYLWEIGVEVNVRRKKR